jgi:hypothetical protein
MVGGALVRGMSPPTAVVVAFSVLIGYSAMAAGIPAFPGAEGFGALTPAGRGGAVIAVTNLDDAGPGSLRAACSAPGPRVVVFRTGGIIDLETDIKISEPFLTIAGQTAPGNGICLRGGTLRVCRHDVVVRYIRARPGDRDAGVVFGNRDALKIEGTNVHNVVIDHCSFSWAVDENVSTWGTPHDVTIQWCVVSEALFRSRHPKGPHSMGLLAGDRTARLSVHHNLLAHNHWRNPYFQGRGEARAEYDLRNNVIYDVGKFGTVARGNLLLSCVSNVYLPGPTTSVSEVIHVGLDAKTPGEHPLVFLRDNQAPGCIDGAADNWVMVKNLTDLETIELHCTKEPAGAVVGTMPASDVLDALLADVGATRPSRDAVDARIVTQVKERSGRVIDSQEEVGGWPQYPPGTPPVDSDGDGMPDAWEKRHGFDPNARADGSADRDGDGYTNLEAFLNETTP